MRPAAPLPLVQSLVREKVKSQARGSQKGAFEARLSMCVRRCRQEEVKEAARGRGVEESERAREREERRQGGVCCVACQKALLIVAKSRKGGARLPVTSTRGLKETMSFAYGHTTLNAPALV